MEKVSIERHRNLVPRGSLEDPKSLFHIKGAISESMCVALDAVEDTIRNCLVQPDLVAQVSLQVM